MDDLVTFSEQLNNVYRGNIYLDGGISSEPVVLLCQRLRRLQHVPAIDDNTIMRRARKALDLDRA
jgi:hypothetical protein